MSACDEIRRLVEERVRGRLLPALLEAGLKQHAKHGFKTQCDCDYCTVKRAHTWYMSRHAYRHNSKKYEHYHTGLWERHIDRLWEEYTRELDSDRANDGYRYQQVSTES
jgi:hypothetical protein